MCPALLMMIVKEEKGNTITLKTCVFCCVFRDMTPLGLPGNFSALFCHLPQHPCPVLSQVSSWQFSSQYSVLSLRRISEAGLPPWSPLPFVSLPSHSHASQAWHPAPLHLSPWIFANTSMKLGVYNFLTKKTS